MRTTIITILAITIAILIGCEQNTIVDSQAPTVQELEAIVKGNSLTLLEAVELFAIENFGYYPASADSDTTFIGKTLIDYLPEGERLINPFTGLKDQPIDSAPSLPGEIGYYKFHPNLNVYFIKGFGVNSIVVEHDNIDELEALVIADCLVVQSAVEAWRSDFSMGYYPYDNLSFNDIGNTVYDYLPDGHFMKNRFTMSPVEPSVFGGMPYVRGAIGYQCKQDQAIPVGYTITGVGFEEGVGFFQINVN